ncbi:DNA transformation protein [Mitsuaria sp. PDC51]|uniref:TfoX/Sxy family protein n=1 Tax=Mitsuaria sp. PDC51 TaxID=1881035 RepID=UPI0008E4E8BB|nr:TfoX/Sxy family protein [Mitsuaria sp. PDC51]SFR90949.1 DNA transformation protein [Mitsuaria sp. PDC51]
MARGTTTTGTVRRVAGAGSDFANHCMELLAPLGPVLARRMFGGFGLYVDDLFLAIISRDELYLKADAVSQPRYLEAGCEPFRYAKTGKDGRQEVASLNYFRPPEETLESTALMLPWGRLAMESALRSANAKPKASTPKKSAGTTAEPSTDRKLKPVKATAPALKRSPGAGRTAARKKAAG